MRGNFPRMILNQSEEDAAKSRKKRKNGRDERAMKNSGSEPSPMARLCEPSGFLSESLNPCSYGSADLDIGLAVFFATTKSAHVGEVLQKIVLSTDLPTMTAIAPRMTAMTMILPGLMISEPVLVSSHGELAGGHCPPCTEHSSIALPLGQSLPRVRAEG